MDVSESKIAIIKLEMINILVSEIRTFFMKTEIIII